LTADELPDNVGRVGDVRTIEVDPRQQWMDTGIWISAGDVVTVDAAGRVQLSTNPNDVASPSGAWNDRRAPDAPLRSERAGALIARIGGSEPFLIGERQSLVAPTYGRLYLGVNDDHLADNIGVFRVEIAVRRRF
jgi:hypothetical protein